MYDTTLLDLHRMIYTRLSNNEHIIKEHYLTISKILSNAGEHLTICLAKQDFTVPLNLQKTANALILQLKQIELLLDTNIDNSITKHLDSLDRLRESYTSEIYAIANECLRSARQPMLNKIAPSLPQRTEASLSDENSVKQQTKSFISKIKTVIDESNKYISWHNERIKEKCQ